MVKPKKGRSYDIQSMIYKGYSIEFNIYGQNEYTVEFEGDDVWFTSLSEAKRFVDRNSLKG